MDEEGWAVSLLGDRSGKRQSLSPANSCKEVTVELEEQRVPLPPRLSPPTRFLLVCPLCCGSCS